MSGVLPDEIAVRRSDPVFMAHAYLTKVPVPAIRPFIEAFTQPGDVVIDPFAGSGMTGVAAAALGRRARLFDISVLGQHIGRNYLNLVDSDLLRKYAADSVREVRAKLGSIYNVACQACDKQAELAKSVWSIVVECSKCATPVNYYRAMEAADWRKPSMGCPTCATPVSSRCRRLSEEAVLDYVVCGCSSTQREQPAQPVAEIDLRALGVPQVEITPDRQMYKASALGKHGLTTVASFYSSRNLAVLTTLHQEITAITDEAIRSKLLFAFTASLTRASKRYQWSRQRPLNAANANYYVASVFYEWNVLDLFSRKVEAAIRSDDWIRSEMVPVESSSTGVDATYELGSADAINLPSGSADYVFTDPPFGSNLFYADMALFQEAWLDGFTDVDQEAVIDRGSNKKRSANRYEDLLTGALTECRRILKPGGRVSMVFGNSSGAVWALVQRAVAKAGLAIEPDHIVVLDKGQRSVKGLASGFENVATLDLVLTMTAASMAVPELHPPTAEEIESATRTLVGSSPQTPSHLYLELLRWGFRERWDLSQLNLSAVTDALLTDGWDVDSKSGRLLEADRQQAS